MYSSTRVHIHSCMYTFIHTYDVHDAWGKPENFIFKRCVRGHVVEGHCALYIILVILRSVACTASSSSSTHHVQNYRHRHTHQRNKRSAGRGGGCKSSSNPPRATTIATGNQNDKGNRTIDGRSRAPSSSTNKNTQRQTSF